MVKLSMIVMLVLTVLIATGLRWREQRLPVVAKAKRLDLMARGKKGLDRWVTAAALAAVSTMVVVGGLHWLKIWVN